MPEHVRTFGRLLDTPFVRNDENTEEDLNYSPNGIPEARLISQTRDVAMSGDTLCKNVYRAVFRVVLDGWTTLQNWQFWIESP